MSSEGGHERVSRASIKGHGGVCGYQSIEGVGELTVGSYEGDVCWSSVGDHRRYVSWSSRS